MSILKKAFQQGFKKESVKADHGGTRKQDVPEEQQREPGNYDDDNFNPDLTPKEMLERGVFGHTYFKEVPEDLPDGWFSNVDFEDNKKKPERNFYNINASQPMKVWKEKGWINEKADPKGWFQWFGRYHQGRRMPEEDKRQISRWKQFKRHKAQVEKNCDPGDENCRRKQKQALLHWAYDPESFDYNK